MIDEGSLKILWIVFSAGWMAYLAFVFSISGRHKKIGEQIRSLRERLGPSK